MYNILLRRVISFVKRFSVFLKKWRIVRYVMFWRQFYKLKKLGVPVITLKMAKKKGIRDIYHLNKGVGDALMFAGVAKEYHRKTGVRPLLFVPQWNVFRYCDFCWFLWDWKFQIENVPKANNTMDVFYYFYSLQQTGHPLKIDSYVFNLKPLEYLKNGYVWGNTFSKLFGGFPKRGQIMQWVANRMDLTGDFIAKPEIQLTQYEKDFGKFAKGKIVIKCGGNGPYKYLLPSIAQGIVDELKGEYEFLQVGDGSDPMLHGVENLFSLNLREFAGIMYHARIFIGAIGGMMHLARAMDCPAVILHGCEHDDFYFPSQRKVFSEHRCTLCAERCWWPDKDDERRCPNRYRCIVDFNVRRVADIIREEMKKPRELATTPDVFKCVGHIVDCNTTMNWWFTLDDFITDFEWPKPEDNFRQEGFEGTFDYLAVRPDYSKYQIGTVVDGSVPHWGIYDSMNWSNKIISDNPLIIRLKPRPSYFAYIAKVADLQKKWTVEWSHKEPEDDTDWWLKETKPKPEYATFEGYVRQNHLMNFLLWNTENLVRRKDIPDSAIIDAKHRIDIYNQWRNDFIEKIDETMNMILAPALPGAFKAPINTESLGMIVDRLSILALRMYYMKKEAKKLKNREENMAKLKDIQRQRLELLESTKFLIVDYMNGARQPRSYHKYKIYDR